MRTVVLNKGPLVRRRLLLALIAGVPLIFSRFTNDPINVPKLTLLTTGLGLVLALRLVESLQGAPMRGLDRLAVPALAVALPLSVGWLLAPYKGWSFVGEYGRYQGLLPYLLVILLGVLVADAFDHSNIHQVAWALLIGGGVAGAYAIVQRLGLDPFTWALAGGASNDISSTLGNSNFTGGFLAMVLPLAVGLFVVDPPRRLPVAVLGAIAAVGWMVAESQGAWAAGLAGLIVTAGFLASGRARWAGVAAIAAAAVIALAVAGTVVNDLDQPPTVKGAPSTAAVRAFAWGAAWRQFTSDPWSGNGPNSFALLGVQHRSLEDAITFDTNFPDDPHSVPLSFATAAGILGLIGFGVLIASVLYRGFKIGPDNPMGVALFGAAIAYLIQALVSLDEIAIRMAFWTAIGGMTASLVNPPDKARKPARRKRGGKAAEPPLRRIPAVVAVSLIPLVAIWWSGRVVLADARIHWGISAFNGGDLARGLETMEAAVALRPDPNYRWRLGQEVGAAATKLKDASMFQTAVASFDYLAGLPHYQGLIARARVLDGWRAVDQSFEERAVTAYRELVRIDPLNPHLRVQAADVFADAGRLEEALMVLEPAIEEAGGYVAAVWGELAVLRYDLEDFDGAEQAMRKALALDPTDPQALVVEEALQARDR